MSPRKSALPVSIDQAPSPKPVARSREIGCTLPIDPVCDRIFTAWLRGVSERTLATMYGLPRASVEAVNRQRVQQLRKAA